MNTALIIAQLLLEFTTKAQQLAALYNQAQLEGRDVTMDELLSLAGDDDVSRAALQADIDRIRAAGG